MIPQASDPCWRRILTGTDAPASISLGSRMLVARLRKRIQLTPSLMNEAINELHGYYSGNPAAAAELSKF